VEQKKTRMRLYDSSFSELRKILEWQFQKLSKAVLTVPSYNSSLQEGVAHLLLEEKLNDDQPLDQRTVLW